MVFYKNKWSMFSIIFYWILSIVMILNYIHYHLSTGHFGGAEGGIPLFYEIIFSSIQILDAVYGFVAFMIPPLFFSHECIRQRITHCDYLQSVRLRHKKTFFSPLLLRQFKTNFIIIYFVFFVKMVLQAIMVHIFYSPFIFEENSSYLTWSFTINFSTNSFVNLICTIVISDYIAFISNGYRWNFPDYRLFNLRFITHSTRNVHIISRNYFSFSLGYFCISCDIL